MRAAKKDWKPKRKPVAYKHWAIVRDNNDDELRVLPVEAYEPMPLTPHSGARGAVYFGLSGNWYEVMRSVDGSEAECDKLRGMCRLVAHEGEITAYSYPVWTYKKLGD